jgi:hypothetical protein
VLTSLCPWCCPFDEVFLVLCHFRMVGRVRPEDVSLMRCATVTRQGIFLSACIFRAISARWLVPLWAAASLLWHLSWVHLFLKASLLRRATVARRDTFLQAAANFLWDPQIPLVSSFGSSHRSAACFLPLCLLFRPLTGFTTASSTGTSCCWATSGFVSTEVGSFSSRRASWSASIVASNLAWLV